MWMATASLEDMDSWLANVATAASSVMRANKEGVVDTTMYLGEARTTIGFVKARWVWLAYPAKSRIVS